MEQFTGRHPQTSNRNLSRICTVYALSCLYAPTRNDIATVDTRMQHYGNAQICSLQSQGSRSPHSASLRPLLDVAYADEHVSCLSPFYHCHVRWNCKLPLLHSSDRTISRLVHCICLRHSLLYSTADTTSLHWAVLEPSKSINGIKVSNQYWTSIAQIQTSLLRSSHPFYSNPLEGFQRCTSRKAFLLMCLKKVQFHFHKRDKWRFLILLPFFSS